jgi:hypothetical protein
MLAYFTYSGDPTAASPANPAAKTAAVAESAPTTRWRDDPKNAYNAIGNRIVKRPVITGVPAILVYPITSGIASVASVTPARMSFGS